MEYGRIEKFKDGYRVVLITTVCQFIGVCERNAEFDYAIFPFTYNSLMMVDDALKCGNNAVLTERGFDTVKNSGVISPLGITIEVNDTNVVNLMRTKLLKEREDAMADITLGNVYRYLNNFYNMFTNGDNSQINSDKIEIDAILDNIERIDVKLNEISHV